MRLLMFALLAIACFLNSGCSTSTWGSKGGIVKGSPYEVTSASLTEDNRLIINYKVSYYDGYGNKLNRDDIERSVSFDLEDFTHKEPSKETYGGRIYVQPVPENYKLHKLYVGYNWHGVQKVIFENGILKTKQKSSDIFHTNPNIISGATYASKTQQVVVENKGTLEDGAKACFEQETPTLYYRVHIGTAYPTNDVLLYKRGDLCNAYIFPRVIFRDETLIDHIKGGGIKVAAIAVDVVTAPFQLVGLVILAGAGSTMP